MVMKKINLTIISGGVQQFPGCADILEDCPEFSIVARAGGLHDSGIWGAMGRSDVVLLDEAVLELDGADAIRSICDCYPLLKLLLILDYDSDERVMEAIALGATGVMERTSIRSMLRKAIPVLYAGESWISRDLVHSLRKQMKQELQDGSGGTHPMTFPGRGKYN
jgi:DNA-binding NarL/FixJ family response regulator